MRLQQDLSNYISFSLYVTLGYKPYDHVTWFKGFMNEKKIDSQVDIDESIYIRNFTANDIDDCDELHKSGNGYSRRNCLKLTATDQMYAGYVSHNIVLYYGMV